MTDSPFVEERHAAILEKLRVDGRVSVKELSAALGVSAITIRQDLRILDEERKLKKTHGGAILTPPQTQTISGMAFYFRLRRQRDEKHRIGAVAATHVRQGYSIALDASTTAFALLPHLKKI